MLANYLLTLHFLFSIDERSIQARPNLTVSYQLSDGSGSVPIVTVTAPALIATCALANVIASAVIAICAAHRIYTRHVLPAASTVLMRGGSFRNRLVRRARSGLLMLYLVTFVEGLFIALFDAYCQLTHRKQASSYSFYEGVLLTAASALAIYVYHYRPTCSVLRENASQPKSPGTGKGPSYSRLPVASTVKSTKKEAKRSVVDTDLFRVGSKITSEVESPPSD